MRRPLELMTERTPYLAYSYSYPHKSAYRSLDPPELLTSVWSSENLDSLFLYLHIPFCEYRCGFCNLFTSANADGDLTSAYLDQLRCEAWKLRRAIPDAHFARIAIGGGTPTFLDEQQLTILFDITETIMGAGCRSIPVSCEASPATLTFRKASLLRRSGVDRLSLGIQTFDDNESQRLGRPQLASLARHAIDIAREHSFPTLNLDLIYGIPDQTVASWMHSVEATIAIKPEEIYLYPLYVRELTGLGNIAANPSDNRLEAYREARAALLAEGYEQISLRMFRLPTDYDTPEPLYCCQSDGMVGLGCGARSYTRAVHYSSEFAVGRTGVRSILLDYVKRDSESFDWAYHGYRLDLDDQQRRFVIQSLLQSEGLIHARYCERFNGTAFSHLPQLSELVQQGLAINTHDSLRLTDLGMERSDVIGPWLYSERVQTLMQSFSCL